MHRTKDGERAVTVYLPPGRVVYLRSVDGVMWLDPENEARLPNQRLVVDLAGAERRSWVDSLWEEG